MRKLHIKLFSRWGELKAASGEATVNTAESQKPQSTFKGGAKGSLYAKEGIIERNHMPSMDAFTRAGIKMQNAKGSAIQMLYAEHRSFISTGSGEAAVAFRKQEAGLLSQGKYMEAFDLNAQRVRTAYGDKYNGAIQEARTYYEKEVVPILSGKQ